MANPAERLAERLEESKWPTEKPHPMRKIPGFPREATWSKYQGRWVITRKTS